MAHNEDYDTQSVEEFCKRNKISRGHFYNLLKSGQGPDTMEVGRRRLISNESAARWRKKMENEAGAAS